MRQSCPCTPSVTSPHILHRGYLHDDEGFDKSPVLSIVVDMYFIIRYAINLHCIDKRVFIKSIVIQSQGLEVETMKSSIALNVTVSMF